MLLIWLRELRAPFFTASIIPVILGTALAFSHAGAFSPVLFILTIVGVLLLHAGTNMANDYFDFRSGADIANKNRSPFSGGSGLLPALNPARVHQLARIFFLAGGLTGAYLSLITGPVVIVLGVIGAASGYFYTFPKVNIAAKGVGEALVGLNFGVLIVMGTFVVQTGFFSLSVFAASLPVTFLITAVLFINQFPDYDADMACGKTNMVVRLGREKAVAVYSMLTACAYLSIAVAALLGLLPVLSLLALLTLPLATTASSILREKHSSFPDMLPANRLTVINHMATGLLLTATVAVSAVL